MMWQRVCLQFLFMCQCCLMFEFMQNAMHVCCPYPIIRDLFRIFNAQGRLCDQRLFTGGCLNRWRLIQPLKSLLIWPYATTSCHTDWTQSLRCPRISRIPRSYKL